MSNLGLDELGIPAAMHSTMSAEHASLLAATLDHEYVESRPLPLLSHWAFFNPVEPTSALGADGHPGRSGPTLAAFPRRMWVGGEVAASGALHLDTPAIRRTRLQDHALKHGSSGDLLIVTLEHTVEQRGKIVITERQDVVYRSHGTTAPCGPPVEPPPATGWRESFTPTAPLLFRFSAVTFNSHRIHYDHAYATEVEHYPDIVVHGPLTAMLLASAAERHAHLPIITFAYRASSPLFVLQPIRIDGLMQTTDNEPTSVLTATRHDGSVAMSATAAHRADVPSKLIHRASGT
jgi:3-methylfumaryl-CoA hydratase